MNENAYLSFRIGTTGDYPPFSFRDAKGQFCGADIALFEAFAATKGSEVNWIQTTWSSLSQDLQASFFIATIGGISASPERQAQFLLSHPLREDRKVILCHHDFTPIFINKSLSQLNQPEISWIYNPGGTNEAFVKA